MNEIELSTGIQEYITHLEAIGKKPSTVGTAKRTMALIEEFLGAKKIIAKILPVHVSGFFNSEAATTQPCKGGTKPRAKPSILQIRRIVRGALVYWHGQGYSKNVPLPKDEKKFLEPKKSGAAPKELKVKTGAILSDEAKAGLKAQIDELSGEVVVIGQPDAADDSR